jgi:glycerol-3-phosphate O-acyltransferase
MDTDLTHKQSTSPTQYPIPSVIEDLSQWPIYKMYQDKDNFMQDVLEFTKNRIVQQKKGGSLRDKLAAVLFSERARIIENPWKVDPPDEMDFWSDIRKRMFKGSFKASENGETDNYNEELLERILNRYIHEITGNFKISTYKQARILLPMLFNTILNTMTLRRADLRQKLSITGSVEHLRSLVTKGTVVLVPTHFSNLDSILIGWAADRIGMLAFSYGAGLNLFNSKIMAYFFSRLGAYTLDRRKKNPFYLESLKSFSQLSIERGVHTLFFPGGTRSRSGALESRVKLGLLGTAIDAQNAVLERGEENKIYIVPVVLNYHFVLEAKSLIEQHLKYTGKEQYLVEQSGFGGASKFLKFLRQFVSNSSEIIVNFGRPMDVMGNFVDMEGRSMDRWGREIELKDYFVSQNKVRYDRQRNEMYTTRLSKTIVERYRVENIVLSSHLVAYTAFNIIRKRFPDLDLYGVLRLPKEDKTIRKELLYKNIELLRIRLKEMMDAGQIQLSKIVETGSVEEMVKDGIANVGAFHVKKPLKLNKNGDFESQDLNLLYYYHNRMIGYNLSHMVNPHILHSDTK